MNQNTSKHTDIFATPFPYLSEFFLTIKILAPLWPAIILFGVISNITNIVVFLKAGAKDNVTVLLLCLAMSDLVFLILITPSTCSYVIQALVSSYSWPFDYFILHYLLYWPAFTAYDLSAFISVSLGVMRCACVAMPLKFKLVFTKARTIKWVMFLVILAVCLRIPVLSINRISWRTDSQTNVSSPYLKAVNNRYMSHINDIINRGIVIYILYITMVSCVIILTFKLYQASKIRRSYTTEQLKVSDKSRNKPVAEGLHSKDMQVVKSVVLVCIIFILSQLTFLLTSTTRLIRPDFDNGQELVYLFGILSQINRTCSYLNASLNIFVYYSYNSKYRSVLHSLVSVKGRK
ncbi:hypothetical protein RRG08_007884 [Elysia crispata]|uniref:G-protein coupled receptors family 1 profile domain-containing protein n=1 Tax=Elysia crispata TaxID=231223 RepID=A0AAE1CNT7_9GAST|nr:hypothetical protein RRG08_007884 [Elysia crispata]